ncbi:DUF3397 family protein [Alkalibacterium sp. AK22]|uniref:DUF3397 family protein n=1 Tax=Alkalibacterium sp. AK22 TaxID=1229520 RepID=UPI0009E05F21|nr:DUF3397 family protein [Alkalibacterium sp. AK22]
MICIQTSSVNITLTLFYFSPFLILMFSRRLNRQFRLVYLPLKVVDLMIPYLLVLAYFFGRYYFQINIVPYIVMGISVIGLGSASYQTFVKKELTVYLFLRRWWRYVFIIMLTVHSLIGLVSAWMLYM